MNDDTPRKVIARRLGNRILQSPEEIAELVQLHFAARARIAEQIEAMSVFEKRSPGGGLFGLRRDTTASDFKRRLFHFCDKRVNFSFHPEESWETRAIVEAAMEHPELSNAGRKRGRPTKLKPLLSPDTQHAALLEEIEGYMAEAPSATQTEIIHYYMYRHYKNLSEGTEGYRGVFKRIEKYVSGRRAAIGKPLKRGRPKRR